MSKTHSHHQPETVSPREEIPPPDKPPLPLPLPDAESDEFKAVAMAAAFPAGTNYSRAFLISCHRVASYVLAAYVLPKQ